jgi:hypothetical protein
MNKTFQNIIKYVNVDLALDLDPELDLDRIQDQDHEYKDSSLARFRRQVRAARVASCFYPLCFHNQQMYKLLRFQQTYLRAAGTSAVKG